MIPRLGLRGALMLALKLDLAKTLRLTLVLGKLISHRLK